MSRRPKRSTTNKGLNPALEKLKQVRRGKSHQDFIKFEANEPSLMNEEDAAEIDDSDFIVNDEGASNHDYNLSKRYYSDDEFDLPSKSGKQPSKNKTIVPVKKENRIDRYLQSGTSIIPKSAKSKKSESSVLEDIFKELDEELDEKLPQLKSKTKPTTNSIASTMFRTDLKTDTVSKLYQNIDNNQSESYTNNTSRLPSQMEMDNDFMDDPVEQQASAFDNKPSITSNTQVKIEPVTPVKIKSPVKNVPIVSKEEVNVVEPQWHSLQAKMYNQQKATATESLTEKILFDPTQVPADQIFMYWIDAYAHESTGQIYLLGKIYDAERKSFVSCCAIVKNLLRTLYLLPEPLILEDDEPDVQTAKVTQIIQEINPRFSRVYRGLEYEVELVSRKYCFDVPADIPPEATYVKVTYPLTTKTCNFAKDLQGQSFRHVFGKETSPLESFLINHKLMGPSWIAITNHIKVDPSQSYCKFEYEVSSPGSIRPLNDDEINQFDLKPPPLTIATVNLKTVTNSKDDSNEVIAINMLVHRDVDIDADTNFDMLKPIHVGALKVPKSTDVSHRFQAEMDKAGLECRTDVNESSLLRYFFAKLAAFDPDILIGHNFLGYTLDVLLTRAKALKIDEWGRLGRLRRKTMPKFFGEASYQQRALINGRLICDSYLGAKDAIKSKSYSLTQLASTQLNIQRQDIPQDSIPDYFREESNLAYLFRHNDFDCMLTAHLTFKLQLLPLSRQLTQLAGNLWMHTLTGARAKRNEYLLLHAFHAQDTIVPDRIFNDKSKDGDEFALIAEETTSTRRKPAYSGGLVLEPKRGLYDSMVLLLDFNSLYPSIIQEFNICFTTVERDPIKGDLPDTPEQGQPTGLLPKLLKTLIDRRSQVKSLLKNKNITPTQAAQYDIRQKALKLTANSMYGCLGYPQSRFYAKQLAMLITAKGREILQSTVDLATDEGLEVIYGDTDSIMINTHMTDLLAVQQLASQFKRKANARYKHLELDLDGIYHRLLLLQKKKYAAMLITDSETKNGITTYRTKVEVKGLDLVRREFCELSHTLSQYVLTQLLSNADRETAVDAIHSYLSEFAQKLSAHQFPLEQFQIFKSISKPLEKYHDSSTQPHVQVGLRLQKTQNRLLAKNETVSFVITHDPEAPSNQSYALRAFTVEECVKEGKHIDFNWYLDRQLLPPIVRLCDGVEGTDPSILANCLGMDTQKYKTVSKSESQQPPSLLDQLTFGTEQFANFTKLELTCLKCNIQFNIDKLFTINPSFNKSDLADADPSSYLKLGNECPDCNKPVNSNILNQVIINRLRKEIRTFYRYNATCDDAVCRFTTNLIPSLTHDTAGLGRKCPQPTCDGQLKLQNTASSLYRQLQYLNSIFDPKTNIKNLTQDGLPQGPIQAYIEKESTEFKLVTNTIQKYLKLSSYKYVNLKTLFDGI